MNILSYRGPSTAGGVSTALARINSNSADGKQRWWYIDKNSVQTRSNTDSEVLEIVKIPQKIIEGHYRYCNNFIWPVLHDLPQQAILDKEDRELYMQFNIRFARHFMRAEALRSSGLCFVNDYQLAISSGLLGNSPMLDVILFWHVPWPKTVTSEFRPYLVEIAEGLLGAVRLGFHTGEYAQNFLTFVHENMPMYEVDFADQVVASKTDDSISTAVVACPLGLDVDFWVKKAEDSTPVHHDLDLSKEITCPFVLSVDRADYTKGVVERMNAIEEFFAKYPEQIGKLQFVQVCQPSRTGLPNFDHYWEVISGMGAAINEKLSTPEWKPIVWVEKPIPPLTLAWLYKKATTMMINPVRDGLNLTAKEFAACSKKGAMLLSPEAGVWHELGSECLALDPDSREQMAHQIAASLKMSDEEKRSRLTVMKRKLRTNTLVKWWLDFEGGMVASQNVVAPLAVPSIAAKRAARRG
jgi:trehalose 6-phosphate synthase/phosphatase